MAFRCHDVKIFQSFLFLFVKKTLTLHLELSWIALNSTRYYIYNNV